MLTETHLHQLVPMNQQLPHVPLLGRRSPQPRKPPLPQQPHASNCFYFWVVSSVRLQFF